MYRSGYRYRLRQSDTDKRSTYIHTYLLTYIHTHIQTYIRTYIQTHTYIYTPDIFVFIIP